MAKFLTTIEIAAQLQSLITEADEILYLVSPYLQISNDFRELLALREKKKKETIIIYGKNELTPDQLKFLTSLRYLYLKFYEKLHAKCYINDTKLIITSMNFYEYSMINNKEMGVIYDISDDVDKEIYNKAFEYVQLIDDNSDDKPFELNTDYNKTNSVKGKREEIKEKEKKVEEQLKSIKQDYSKSKYKSTSALSKIIGISSKELFEIFEEKGWIIKDGKTWILTNEGERNGGQMKKGQYGAYSAWPEEIIKEVDNLK